MLLLLFFINTVLASFDLIDFEKNACPELSYYPVRFFVGKCYKNPNVLSSCPEIIQRYNYTYEEHKIQTPDGYILTIFRIVPEGEKRQPVFLQHGLAQDCESFLNTGEKSLAFTLAEQNYDVWIGNSRGTRYSRKHITLSSLDYRFWDYNLDDMAMNDTIPCLEKIANLTEQKVIYIGFSRGATNFFMAASAKPQEVAKLVKFAITPGPIAYLSLPSSLDPITDAAPFIGQVLKTLRIFCFLYNTDAILRILVNVCSILPYVCRNVLFSKSELFPPDDLLVFWGSFPSTVSVSEILQYAQIYRTKKFAYYDYGKEGNLARYGQENPPTYDLGKINVPVALFYGKNDALAPYEVVNRTFNEIGTSKKMIQKVPETGSVEYVHVDFLYGNNTKKILYDDIISRVENSLIN